MSVDFKFVIVKLLKNLSQVSNLKALKYRNFNGIIEQVWPTFSFNYNV